MRTFTSTDRFPLVIAPFRAFLHNLTEQDQLACLERIREHLAPRGRFAFNVFHPSLEFMAHHVGAMAGVWRWVGTFPRGDGGYVARSDANRYDTTRQLVHSQHRYDEYGPDGILTRSSLHDLHLAYLYPPDLRRLLTQAGFRSIQIYGGFDGRPFESDTDELVIEAGVEEGRVGGMQVPGAGCRVPGSVQGSKVRFLVLGSWFARSATTGDARTLNPVKPPHREPNPEPLNRTGHPAPGTRNQLKRQPDPDSAASTPVSARRDRGRR